MSRAIVMALSAGELAVVFLTIAWLVVAPELEPAAASPAETNNRRQKA